MADEQTPVAASSLYQGPRFRGAVSGRACAPAKDPDPLRTSTTPVCPHASGARNGDGPAALSWAERGDALRCRTRTSATSACLVGVGKPVKSARIRNPALWRRFLRTERWKKAVPSGVWLPQGNATECLRGDGNRQSTSRRLFRPFLHDPCLNPLIRESVTRGRSAILAPLW